MIKKLQKTDHNMVIQKGSRKASSFFVDVVEVHSFLGLAEVLLLDARGVGMEVKHKHYLSDRITNTEK